AWLAPAVAALFLHLLREITGGLLQLVQRLGLRPDGLAGLALLERAGRIAHRAFGAAERIGDVAHAIPEPPHHLAEHAAQPFLLPGGVAHLAHLPHLARIVLAAGLAVLLTSLLLAVAIGLPLLSLCPKAAVEQLLLALHQLVQAAHHL